MLVDSSLPTTIPSNLIIFGGICAILFVVNTMIGLWQRLSGRDNEEVGQ